MTIAKKLNNRAGFTLTEMLAVTVIVALISTCLTVGIRLCLNTYSTSVGASQSQVLVNTLNSILKDELRFAEDVDTLETEDFGDVVTFTSKGSSANGTGTYITCELGKLYFHRETEEREDIRTPLVGSGMYPEGCEVDDFYIFYDEDLKRFYVEYRIYNSRGNVLADMDYTVDPLNPS